MIACLAAADTYVVIIPNELLLISAVAARPKRWFLTAIFVTLGSACGAASFAALIGHYGLIWLRDFAPHLMESKAWIRSSQLIQGYGGWAVGLVSLSPLAQQPIIAAAGLANLQTEVVFLAVLVGRGLKYSLVAWAVAFSPGFLKRLRHRLG